MIQALTPFGGKRFSPLQTCQDLPWGPPSLYTGALSLQVKQSGHGVDYTPPSCSEIEWVELYLFLPALAHSMVTFTFTTYA